MLPWRCLARYRLGCLGHFLSFLSSPSDPEVGRREENRKKSGGMEQRGANERAGERGSGMALCRGKWRGQGRESCPVMKGRSNGAVGRADGAVDMGDGCGVSGWERMRLWFQGLFCFIILQLRRRVSFLSGIHYLPVLV